MKIAGKKIKVMVESTDTILRETWELDYLNVLEIL